MKLLYNNVIKYFKDPPAEGTEQPPAEGED
jgi:hypothetical protein